MVTVFGDCVKLQAVVPKQGSLCDSLALQPDTMVAVHLCAHVLSVMWRQLSCARLLQKQQALVGQMLMEGYGCKQDQAAGKEWMGAITCFF